MILKKPIIILLALSLVATLLLTSPQPVLATPGECPEAFPIMVAYYDWDQDNKELVPDSAFLDLINFSDLVWDGSSDLDGGIWQVKPPPTPQIYIYAVVITDGNAGDPHAYTYLPDGSLGPEPFSNDNVDMRGAGISNIVFCVPQYPVTLASLTGRASGGTAIIEWVTATEIETAGFLLYRSATVDGPQVQVSTNLIAAKGDELTGASYRATDSPGYGTFYYWLRDVDITGTSSLHEPVTVKVLPAIRQPAYRPSLPGK